MGMSAGSGARTRRRRGLPAVNEINVTSLVDVTLVLLIIFMITAPIMQGGVDVQLPRAETRPITPRDGLVVSIDRTGQIFVDRVEVTYEEFRATFRALAQEKGGDGVTLRADARVAYGDVARVLAVIKEGGIANVGLVTEQEEIR